MGDFRCLYALWINVRLWFIACICWIRRRRLGFVGVYIIDHAPAGALGAAARAGGVFAVKKLHRVADVHSPSIGLRVRRWNGATPLLVRVGCMSWELERISLSLLAETCVVSPTDKFGSVEVSCEQTSLFPRSGGSESPQVRAAAPRQPFLRHALEDEILDAVLLAVVSLLRLVAVFVDGVDVGLDAPHLRLGVEPAPTGRDERLVDVADGGAEVAALVLLEERMARALEMLDVRVVAGDDVEIAVPGDFLEEADVAGVEPVVAAGNDHLLAARRRRHDGEIAFRETGEALAGDDMVADAVRFAERALGRRVVRLIHDPEVGQGGARLCRAVFRFWILD